LRRPAFHRPYTRLPRGKHAVAGFALLVFLAVASVVLLSLSASSDKDEHDRSPALHEDAGAAGRSNPHSGPQEISLPAVRQVTSARVFAGSRSGLVSFALIDTSGRLRCYRCRVRYVSASVVKAMLLVAYLNRLAETHRPLTSSHHVLLDAMIRVSDNSAATAIYRHVGDFGLYRLADQAEMSDFAVSANWSTAQITAVDQARFFAQIERLLPAIYRGYARELLTSIVPAQAWGIPQVSRPRWKTFFKGGWRETRRGNLVHQVARLERGRLSLAIAILTDGNPNERYGRATIRGITARLLGS
jgi:Beta-lactamase enzyme family